MPTNMLPMAAQILANDLICQKALGLSSKISFVLQTLGPNEISFRILKETHSYLKNNPYTDISIFCANKGLPIINPNIAIFNTNQIAPYNGNIFVFDIPSWQVATNCVSKNKWLCIYDVMYLHQISKDIVEQINTSNFNIITRSKDHAKFLEKLGFKVKDLYLENINLSQIMELINGQKIQ